LLDFYRLQIQNLGLNNIKLLGYVSDNQLIQYYSDCNLVLVPACT
jgi:glycosyltransferase involved in cell wall biosynthesis